MKNSISRGGLAIPDFVFKYYKTIHLARVIDWCCHRKRKQWVEIEKSLTKIPLEVLSKIEPLIHALKEHPTITPTLKIVRKYFQQMGISPYHSLLCPI